MSPAPTLYGTGRDRRTLEDTSVRPLVAGRPALDFINTVDTHGQLAHEDDLAPGYANLLAWSLAARLVDGTEAPAMRRLANREPRDAAAVRRRAIELRTAIQESMVALKGHRLVAPDHLACLEREHQIAQVHRRLVAVDGSLAWGWVEGAHLDRPLWPLAEDAAALLTSDAIGRVRQCDAEACERYFLDTSRNGSRRFCTSSGCGTVERVRRFRAKHREHDE